MNTAEIRDTVRAILEVDEDDVSNALLNMYIRDGYERIIALERRWPFLEVQHTLPTVVGQRAYALSSIGSGNLREVSSVVDTSAIGRRLQLLSYDDAEGVWVGGLDTPSRPLHFSEWQGNIHLWPKPDAVYTMVVRGYRKPTQWYLTDGGEVDADDRLHLPLVYYVVSQVYQLQEDIELAQFYRRSFDEAVTLARNDIMRPPTARPIVLNRGGPNVNQRWWLQNLGRTLG